MALLGVFMTFILISNIRMRILCQIYLRGMAERDAEARKESVPISTVTWRFRLL
jgi:hypothetical protein